jgi:hypothetical protein
MDLDTRARHAAEGLRRSVSETNLAFTEPPSVRAARTWNPAWAMAAGAVAALVLVFGVWSLRPTVVADDLETTTTTSQVTTTTAITTTTTVPTTETSAVSTPVPVAPVDAAFITITTPFDGQVFTESRVTFSGTTEPGARVFGGPYEATVDPSGVWSILLILSEGSNTATFRAIDEAGNEASASVTAVYQPVKEPVKEPAKDPVKEPVKDPAPFAAFAMSTETSGDPAYGEYYGTGEPGSLVKAISDWGSGETVVKADGSWHLKATFKKVPIGTQFEVKIKDEFGRYAYFPMTRTS